MYKRAKMLTEFLKTNWFKLIVTAVLILISTVVYYRYVVYIPFQQTEKQAAQEKVIQQNTAQQKELALCLANAYIAYTQNWATSCKDISSSVKTLCNSYVSEGVFSSLNDCVISSGNPDISGSAKCNLPNHAADGINADYKSAKDECAQLYSAK